MISIKEYLLSLLAASVLIAMLGMLAPDGGIGKHLRFLLSLFLICVLASPLSSLPNWISDLQNADLRLPWEEQTDMEEDYSQQMEEALSASSKEYFNQSLTQMLTQRFDAENGTLRCVTEWDTNGDELRPKRITVLLSQSAIWKDPQAIRSFVAELLECECVVALE